MMRLRKVRCFSVNGRSSGSFATPCEAFGFWDTPAVSGPGERVCSLAITVKDTACDGGEGVAALAARAPGPMPAGTGTRRSSKVPSSPNPRRSPTGNEGDPAGIDGGVSTLAEALGRGHRHRRDDRVGRRRRARSGALHRPQADAPGRRAACAHPGARAGGGCHADRVRRAAEPRHRPRRLARAHVEDPRAGRRAPRARRHRRSPTAPRPWKRPRTS